MRLAKTCSRKCCALRFWLLRFLRGSAQQALLLVAITVAASAAAPYDWGACLRHFADSITAQFDTLLCWPVEAKHTHCWGGEPRKHYGSHIDASHSRQPLVKGERLVRYEVNAVILLGAAAGVSH